MEMNELLEIFEAYLESALMFPCDQLSSRQYYRYSVDSDGVLSVRYYDTEETMDFVEALADEIEEEHGIVLVKTKKAKR